MSSYELWSLFFSGFNTVITMIGIVLALKQLNASYEIKKKEYKHTQMMSAKEKLSEYKTLLIDDLKQHPELDYLNNNKRIPLEIILKAMEDKKIKQQIIMVLGYYESLISGINQKLYDEEVIKTARKETIIRMVNAYQEYIKYRREVENHPYAFIELTNWVESLKPKSNIKDSIF